MFSRRFDPPKNQSFSKSNKVTKSSSSFRKENGITKRRHESRSRRLTTSSSAAAALQDSPSSITPTIVTLMVGQEQRLFAAHEDVLSYSPYLRNILTEHEMQTADTKRIYLPDEVPEVFSSVLEFLYKGDYYPRLIHNKRRNSWGLEAVSEDRVSLESTIFVHSVDGDLLKDTVIYCTAEKYGLEELKKISLRKQGLQSGIQCSTILASARYAYDHTPDTDSKLRAHYLALIIRSRSTFKRSGTMQLEMFNGGTQLFFDLFVALCTHIDDVSAPGSTPRSSRH